MALKALLPLAVLLSFVRCDARREAPAPRRPPPVIRPTRLWRYGPPPAPQTRPTLRIPPGETTPCTADSDCPRGICFTEALDAQYSQAFRDCPDGWAWRNLRRLNTCVRPACRSDEECPDGERCAEVQMLPFPQRVCVPARCRTGLDCRARAQGACIRYLAGTRCEHGSWACSYPTDECHPNDPTRRCAAPPGRIAYCAPRNGRFRCVSEAPPPP